MAKLLFCTKCLYDWTLSICIVICLNLNTYQLFVNSSTTTAILKQQTTLQKISRVFRENIARLWGLKSKEKSEKKREKSSRYSINGCKILLQTVFNQRVNSCCRQFTKSSNTFLPSFKHIEVVLDEKIQHCKKL